MGRTVPPDQSYMVQGPAKAISYAALTVVTVVGAPWLYAYST